MHWIRLLLIGFVLLNSHPLWAASQGPNSPETTVEDTGVGTVAWSNYNNSQSQNDTYASATLDVSFEESYYIKATKFGFSIPAGATIDTIQVEIDRYGGAPGFDIYDNYIRIVKDGVIGSADKANGVAWATSDSDTYTSYGGDLWDETWTSDDINDSTFGMAISAISNCGICFAGGDNVFVDHVRITVTYTAAAGGTTFQRRRVIITEPK